MADTRKLRIGNRIPDKIMLGNVECKKAYLGSTLVWERENIPLVITPNTIHGIPSSGGSYEVTIKATGNWTCSYNPTWARPITVRGQQEKQPSR